MIVFNTARPLFRDVRLRRAVNYALDRRALAAAFADAPGDAIVPPAIPGFRSNHVYPVDAPDVATARRLVGQRQRHAVIAICGDPRLAKLAGITRDDLARVGITTTVIGSQQCPGRYRRADLLFVTNFGGWNDLELDPAVFIGQTVGSAAYGSPLGPGSWRRAGLRREVERARVLRGPTRHAAYRQIQAQLMRMAPVAPFGSFVWGEYLSPRVGCRVNQAEFGFLDLGELCKSR
jgi:ABC-type transport system substrate-binding protein